MSSNRQLAKALGVSETAVRKAEKAGRIARGADGSWDIARARAAWGANTDAAQQRPARGLKPVPEAAVGAVRETLREHGEAVSAGPGSGPGQGMTFLQARTANEVLKAQERKLRLQRLKGELVDRALVMLAPGAALRRARQRQALGVLQRSYEGARTGRRTEGWITAGTSANAEIGTGLVRLRDRSRDLVRNNAWAAKAMQAITTNLVGTGIVPRARAENTETAAGADRLWSRFAATADADGLTDLYGIQALAVRAMAESGEVLVRLRDRGRDDPGPEVPPLAVPLQLQLLEADHLDAGRTGELADGGFVLQGIEHDPLGRRRAYWLFPVHPGEVASFRRASLTSVPVPAQAVLHLFERQRPGQVRGVPWLAPVLLRLRDLDEYDDAELVRKKIEACFAAFVTGDEDGETLGTASTDARGRRVESFEPGMIEYLVRDL